MAAISLSSLPLGFRFHPTDEELVNHFLKPKITGRSSSGTQVIAEIDVCKCEPWDLPDKSLVRSDYPEWFFFAPKDRKYPNGQRYNRATEKGYWKATGKDRTIKSKPCVAKRTTIGMKKTLVFHRGRAPKGTKTNWIMHEYRTTEPEFESRDQGGYVLFRLFRKEEENCPSSNADDTEMNAFSPTPTKSSGAQNEAEVMDEIEPVLNIDSPTPELQEEPISSADVIPRQPSDLKRLLPGDYYTTNQSLKQEKSSCDLFSPVEEAKVGEKAESLHEVLAKFFGPEYYQTDCDAFPNMGSPMFSCGDYSFTGNTNQQEHIGSSLVGNAGEDALNAYLISALNQDDFSSSTSLFPKEPFAEIFPKHGSWDSASFKDSGSGSDMDGETGFPQGAASSEASQCFYGPSLLPGDALQMDDPVVYPDMTTQLSTLYEDASLLSYDFTGQYTYSDDCGAESLQDLFNNMDELANQKTACDSRDDLAETGIKLRSRHRQQDQTNSENSFLDQGGASRRIRLLRSVGNPPFRIASHDSTKRDDNADKEPRGKAKHELLDSVEESTSEKNHVSNRDGLLDSGIRIRAQQLQSSQDEPFTQQPTTLFTPCYQLHCGTVSDDESSITNDNADKESTAKAIYELCNSLEESSIAENNAMSSSRDDLMDTGIKIRARPSQNSPDEPFAQREGGSISECEWSTRDNHNNITGKTKAGEHVKDNISEGAAAAFPVVLNKHDGAIKSKLRMGTKLTDDGEYFIKSSPLHLQATKSLSVVACTVYLVSSSILLLSCFRARRCSISPGV